MDSGRFQKLYSEVWFDRLDKCRTGPIVKNLNLGRIQSHVWKQHAHLYCVLYKFSYETASNGAWAFHLRTKDYLFKVYRHLASITVDFSQFDCQRRIYLWLNQYPLTRNQRHDRSRNRPSGIGQTVRTRRLRPRVSSNPAEVENFPQVGRLHINLLPLNREFTLAEVERYNTKIHTQSHAFMFSSVATRILKNASTSHSLSQWSGIL